MLWRPAALTHQPGCLHCGAGREDQRPNVPSELRQGGGPSHSPGPPTTWIILEQDGPNHLGL